MGDSLKKYIYLIVIGLVLALKLGDGNSFLEKEIGLNKISYFMLGYDNEALVSNTDINVIDYCIIDNSAVIKPIGDDVILPISGIITEINKDFIAIDGIDNMYYIYGIKDLNFGLYQYYYSNQILAKSNQYMVKCNDINSFLANYSINYEAI